MHHSHTNGFFNTITNWLPLLLILTVGMLYVYALFCLKQKGKAWHKWKSISFITGIVLLSIAVLPSIMHWAHQDLQGHMVQHLLLGMYAPIALVLGAPITLALKALPVKRARVLSTILKSNIFYLISHPFTALLLNTGGMYLLYLSPLYVKSAANPFLHYVVHIHFIAAGYLFVWSVIGPDPAPRRPDFLTRLFFLFISIALHALLSKAMYAYLFPFNSPYSAEQIRVAAKSMYYWGDLSELLILIVLFTQWYKKRVGTYKTSFKEVNALP